MNISNITATALRRGADIKDTIELLQKTLDAILSGKSQVDEPRASTLKIINNDCWTAEQRRNYEATIAKRSHPKRRTMSAATKAKISAAAKLRWKKAWAKGKTSL